MPDTAVVTSPTRERTRHALLLAAVRVLDSTPGSTLADVADAAGVARSTLHRYFPDRSSLYEAVYVFVEEEYAAACLRAKLDSGTGIAAFSRLVGELLPRFGVLRWRLRHRHRTETDERATTYRDDAVETVLRRGRADGTIDPSLTTEWVSALMWAALHSAFALAEDGQATWHEAHDQCLRCLRRAVQAPREERLT